MAERRPRSHICPRRLTVSNVACRIALFVKTRSARDAIRADGGQALVEYSMIIGVVSVVALAALSLMGADVNGAFEALARELARI
jgi:Flp pilus assembly pilin Flp